MSNDSLPALGTDPPFSHKIEVSVMQEQHIIRSKTFLSSPQPPFQNEAKSEIFVMKISFHSY